MRAVTRSAPDCSEKVLIAFYVTSGAPEQNEQFLGALKRARARIPELK
jgi:hypothetical protein